MTRARAMGGTASQAGARPQAPGERPMRAVGTSIFAVWPNAPLCRFVPTWDGCPHSQMNDGKLPPAETGGTPTPPEPRPGEAPEVPAAARPLKFPIVGIGASAGGLEALESLAGRLSHDGMAFVVLQHLAPSHESILTEILARVTSLNVITARDGLEVAVNNVYVTPPGVELAIEEGVLRLSGASDRVPRNSIDNFFRTLASERGPAAIGVVLSGAGIGRHSRALRAIKEEGGITFAQDPSTASQASMPAERARRRLRRLLPDRRPRSATS